MSISLANKYRSTTFDDLVGQDHISNILKYQASHHTRQANYLFFWPRGTGKTSSARLFAKAINCLATSDGNPCNACTNCIAISEGSTMDIMEIDAASHTGVDNIREEIIDKLAYRPTILKKRITIIDEVHMLSKWAFNALLKTMEEPSEWMVFILATTELNKVPDTIVSRCQVFNFKKIPLWQIHDRLAHIADAEWLKSTTGGLEMIASLSDGCMRDAVKYLDQISVMGSVDEESVSQFLGVVSDHLIGQFVQQYRDLLWEYSDTWFEQIISFVEQLANQGIDLTIFPRQLMNYANTHFSTDPSLYSQISILASDLMNQSKRYPHPLVMYKTLLYTRATSDKLQGVSSDKDKVINVLSSWAEWSNNETKSKDLWNIQELFTETSILSSDRDSSTPLTLRSEWQTNETSVKAQNNDNLKHSELSENSKASDTALNTSEPSEISTFISLLSPSLQNILSGQSEITKIENNIAHLIIINPMAKMMLNKKEHHDAICSAISQATGQEIKHLEYSFMSKDDYFAMQMGG